MKARPKSAPAASKPAGALSPARQRELFVHMLRIRCLDERMLKLQRAGRIGFVGTAKGLEAALVGPACALSKQDWLWSGLREGGAALARGMPLGDYIAQMYCNSNDSAKGRQMCNHFQHKGTHYPSWSSVIGTQIPARRRGARGEVARQEGRGSRDLLRRRRDELERLPQRAQLGRGLQARLRLRLRRQRLGDLGLELEADGREELRRQGARLRHAGRGRRRQRRARGARRDDQGRRARARRQGPEPRRAQDLPHARPLELGRPDQVPRRQGARLLGGARPDRGLREEAARREDHREGRAREDRGRARHRDRRRDPQAGGGAQDAAQDAGRGRVRRGAAAPAQAVQPVPRDRRAPRRSDAGRRRVPALSRGAQPSSSCQRNVTFAPGWKSSTTSLAKRSGLSALAMRTM
ncbi:MAG: hypothetical protein IPJ19_01800 [Planctomycetes bacterium]|nr:hypothetical protein [Planctomycetota bacterium]